MRCDMKSWRFHRRSDKALKTCLVLAIPSLEAGLITMGSTTNLRFSGKPGYSRLFWTFETLKMSKTDWNQRPESADISGGEFHASSFILLFPLCRRIFKTINYWKEQTTWKDRAQSHRSSAYGKDSGVAKIILEIQSYESPILQRTGLFLWRKTYSLWKPSRKSGRMKEALKIQTSISLNPGTFWSWTTGIKKKSSILIWWNGAGSKTAVTVQDYGSYGVIQWLN